MSKVCAFVTFDDVARQMHLTVRWSPMIRIEVKDQKDRVILVVEGRLVGVFVPELEHCWREQLAAQVRPVIVDLKAVLSIDKHGRRLLRAMYEGGVTFRGAGISMQDELAAIAQPADPSSGP